MRKTYLLGVILTVLMLVALFALVRLFQGASPENLSPQGNEVGRPGMEKIATFSAEPQNEATPEAPNVGP